MENNHHLVIRSEEYIEKNYYKILGLDNTASLEQIKKKYRSLALQFHPDKNISLSSEEKIKQEEEFKKLSEAYAVLSDPIKRAQYDSGQHVESKNFSKEELIKEINDFIESEHISKQTEVEV